MARQQDLIAGIRMGDIAVSLVASGTSYSPDVSDDLVRRVLDLWDGALEGLAEVGMLEVGEESEEDYPTPQRELQDPRVVRFMEELGEELE